MTDCRDWMGTLRAASYRGAPFGIDLREREGGRRLVVHTFPNRRRHFVEDLGSLPRRFSVTGYTAGDAADADMARLVERLDAAGVGTLVLPVLGALQVRCESFSDVFDKDRLGRLAIEMEFVAEGAASAMASAASTAQAAHDAVAAALEALGHAASAAAMRAEL